MTHGAAGPAGIAGFAAFVATSRLARRGAIHPNEERVFRAINHLPRALLPPVFVVMQAGSLAAVFVVAGVTRQTGRKRLAATIAVTGTAVWAGCKIVKRRIGRGRPGAHLESITVHGADQRGLGYPSGHSAVAFTMAAVVSPHLSRPLRVAAWATAGIVGTSRVYVGAHLPLDVAGGAALGLAVGSAARLLDR